MFNYSDWAIACLIALVSTFLLTYPVKKLAIKIKVVDMPNERKIHTNSTPRLGGLAIFLGTLLGGLYIQPQHDHLLAIVLGAVVILITGALDDRFSLRPVVKLAGQLMAASFLISSDLVIEQITLPAIGRIDLGFLSVLITAVWIVGITNAINLLDGLDGLATGVSTIALSSMFVMAIIDGQALPAALCIILIGANLGFLYHNFHPAHIYMGDAGSNFLGFMIAVVSIVGLFKNLTLFGFIIPVIVLAVPIFDTLFTMVRRAYHQDPIMMPDNKHIHYRLLAAGLSHRQTVLVLYGFSALFGTMAILFSSANVLVGIGITILVLFLLQIFAEAGGLVTDGRRPVLEGLKRLFRRRGKGH
ncbi:MraY family glycosyltransferase [Barrientosiimonas marina]|uniref:Glycosyltransferase family 4 protein n=1 Tax=Lentibacillus kimchii TaxID=1542911 RepID=A0ABW2UX88_9BACI